MATLLLDYLDPNRNINELELAFFSQAIQSFVDQGGNKLAKENNLSVGIAFQNFASPVHPSSNTYEREFYFDISNVAKKTTTKNGKTASPAYATLCRLCGILEDYDEGIKLSQLGEFVYKRLISAQEFSLLLLSKQNVFLDDVYQTKTLTFFSSFFKAKKTLSSNSENAKQELEMYAREFFGDNQITLDRRVDLLLNVIKLSGILCNDGNNLRVTKTGEFVFNDFLRGRDLFNTEVPHSKEKESLYDYLRSIDTGLKEILDNGNKDGYYQNFPGLKNVFGPVDTLSQYEHQPSLEEEFKEWCVEKAKITKAMNDYVRALKYITEDKFQKSKTVWHGIYAYLYEKKAPKNIFEISELNEFEQIFGELRAVFDGKIAPSLNKARAKDIIDWKKEQSGGPFPPSALDAYKKFLIWRENQKKSAQQTSQPQLIPLQDRLTIALKYFEEHRYDADWQKKVDTDDYLDVYSMPDIDVNTLAEMSLEDFKAGFLSKVWAFRNGGARKYNQLSNDEERQAYKAFVVKLKQQLESFDAYFPPSVKCPNGMGVGVVTELLMRFWPKSCCSYNEGLIHDALVVLGLSEGAFAWPKTPTIYQDFMGKCAKILCKMEEMKLPRRPSRDNDETPDYFTVNEFLWFVHDNKDLIEEKVMATIYKPTVIKTVAQTKIENFVGFIEALEEDVAKTGLKYPKNMLKRFVCALLAKPFTVLTGLSGSGKTKLAQAFAKWIGVENTVLVVPVGADWTNNERLLGFPNALNEKNYVLPDTGVLKFIIDAKNNPDLPFFLILDEMNLSHVERYFADFLSAMESEEDVKLHGDEVRYASDGMPVEPKLKFPANLFIIGTMNVDETTYMFSPKVLDRAQVLEFRVSSDDIEAFLSSPTKPNFNEFSGKGAQYAKAFLTLAKERKEKKPGEAEIKEVKNALTKFFPELANLGAEFGYRTASEIVTFVAYYLDASGYGAMQDDEQKGKILLEAIDAAILQKLLPKLHGSRNRLEGVLDVLIKATKKPEVEKTTEKTDAETTTKLYPLTNEKLVRMKTRLVANNFTSFAEA